MLKKYDLNEVEKKYLELKNEIVKIGDFEQWVYANEGVIKQLTSASIYEDLIMLNYKGRHAESELIKILNFDFKKAELFQLIQKLEKIILPNSVKIEQLRHIGENSIYDPYARYIFGFTINEIRVEMNSPFPLDTPHGKSSDQERVEEFIKKLKCPKKYFEIILRNLDTEYVKIVIREEFSEIDPNDYVAMFCGTEEDIILIVDDHRLIINRNFIHSEMKEYWG